MIKTLIFDFGDVFINLDKQGAIDNALRLFELDQFDDAMLRTNIDYEIGKITTSELIDFYKSKFPKLDDQQIIEAWNYIIKDFPIHRFEFVKKLKESGHYKLILLSNTNALHIKYIKEQVPFYDEFKTCFHKFYLSHEIGLRKPNDTIYKFALEKNKLQARECLFIDDTKENTFAADKFGINTWTIDEKSEDVVTLFKTKHYLF